MLRGCADPRCFHIPSAPWCAGPVLSAAQTWYRLFSPRLYDPRKWKRKKAFSPASPPPASPAPRCALPTAGSSARPAAASAGALLVVQGTRRNLEKPVSANETALCPRPSLAVPPRGRLQGSPAAGTAGPSAPGSPAEAAGSPLAPARGPTGGGFVLVWSHCY